MTRHPVLVIGLDGRIVAASELPSATLDTDLDHNRALPGPIADAARALLDTIKRSEENVATTDITLNGVPVTIVALAALAVRRAPVELRPLVTSKLALLSAQALASQVDVTISVADDVPTVVDVDAEKLAWALTTLVGNALRYIQSAGRRPERGTITVAVRYDSARNAVAIEVHDDGPGIPAETASRLFRRDGLNVRGSGLSLLLISDILGAHGGGVSVTSRRDTESHGTTVRLVFPAS